LLEAEDLVRFSLHYSSDVVLQIQEPDQNTGALFFVDRRTRVEQSDWDFNLLVPFSAQKNGDSSVLKNASTTLKHR